MLGNISYKRKIGKNTKLLFQKQGKNHKKWGFCLEVRIGESMLGNRFLKIVQKPQKKPTKKQRFSHFITKKYPYLWKMSNNIAFFDEKMGVHKGIFAFTGLGELWECENYIMHDFQSWKMVSELKKGEIWNKNYRKEKVLRKSFRRKMKMSRWWKPSENQRTKNEHQVGLY